MELLTQARILSQKNDLAPQEFLALNNIGANYYVLLEYGEALNYYIEAYTIALKKLEAKDEMIVINNIAVLYIEEKKFDKANEYFKRAYNIAKENKNSTKVGLYAFNLGNLASKMNNAKLARAYFTEALPLLVSKPKILTLVKIGIGVCDIYQGNPQKGRKSAEELLKTTEDLEYNETGILLLRNISHSYLKENNFEKALIFANKVLEKNPNLNTKVEIFELITEINYKKKNYVAALQYKDSIIKANIEIDKIKNNRLYENSKVKLDIQNYKNQLANNENKSKNERKIFYAIIIAILVILSFIIWTLKNISEKYKQKKLIAERDKQILELELENEKNKILLLENQFEENKIASKLEQHHLKNEIEIKNRKLSVKALYLSGRNEMIEDILSELTKLVQVSKNSFLVNQIQSLKKHLSSNDEWDDFLTHFEEVNKDFIQKLKKEHSNLSANDIRFLSYVYMNLNSKEIASMLNISQDSCRKRKERIISKMTLPDNENLYEYLIGLN
ncbi:tetratricopeptide repeat protein [Flavobacterium sp.]|uniref:tetratricopeptide repeat protein n=1 Tax=Flavobacterium sp. TaxID=239 RepID=UPI0038FC6EEE